MKTFFKSLSVAFSYLLLTACISSTSNDWQPIRGEVDQKSYAIGYETTAQTYQDRVSQHFDIRAFMKGADHWFNQKITLPIEQIRLGMFNRMLDGDVYAYNSGILYAEELQQNIQRLSPNCWGEVINTKSLMQGIFAAMSDVQKNRVRDDDYLREGTEQVLQQCVKTKKKK